MPRNLSYAEKLMLVKRFKKGEKVATICKEAGISRTLFYRWLKYRKFKRGAGNNRHWKKLPVTIEKQIINHAIKNPHYSPHRLAEIIKVSPHGIWNVLKRNRINTYDARIKYREKNVNNIVRPRSQAEKLRIMREFEAGAKASSICKKYEISRTVFYRWLKRYQTNSKDINSLQNLRPKGEGHWKFVHGANELVSTVVKYHPEYSAQKISTILFQTLGQTIISPHGVYNVLKRLGLNTYQMRLQYANNIREAIIITHPQKVIDVPESLFGKIPSLSAIPPPSLWERNLSRVRLFSFGLVGSVIFSSLVFIIIRTVLSSNSFSGRIGMLFSFSSLLFGMVFFLYSLKYYLTIAIVLSFSRRSTKEEGEEHEDGFLSKLFGISIEINENHNISNDTKEYRAGGGLQPDLSNIYLKRHPFVSIHLATYNEKKVVDRLLNAVMSMDYSHLPGENPHHLEGEAAYEVIVVDDSTDETTQIIEDYLRVKSSKLKVQSEGEYRLTTAETRSGITIKNTHRNSREGFKGGALREALKHTDPRAEFVLVFDADFIPYPDTITQFLKYFQSLTGSLDISRQSLDRKEALTKDQRLKTNDNPIAAIQGYQSSFAPDGASADKVAFGGSNIAAIQGYQWHVLNKSENWVTRGVRSEYAGSYVIERSGEEVYGGLKQIAGSVYMVRRDILDSIGWGTSLTEDFELTLKLYEKGYKVVYTPYIQAPAEAVSTIKRLVRQRMRWAEGHSHNIKRMFGRLLWGRWVEQKTIDDRRLKIDGEDRGLRVENQSSTFYPQNLPSIFNHPPSKRWIPSPLTLSEKLEFLYLSPYYLQAFFFIAGTFSWFVAEVVFQVRLPFWTEIWGWSLVFTNLFALPLMNMVGLFLEEAEERDYMGLISFVILSYLVAPFQAYAAIKGFLEDEEGPWFRTPKTGKITDIFTPGRFYRYIFGIFGRPASALSSSSLSDRFGLRLTIEDLGVEDLSKGFGEARPAFSIQQSTINHLPSTISNPYLALATSHNRFQNFKIRPKRLRWVGNTVLIVFISFTTILMSFVPNIRAEKKLQSSTSRVIRQAQAQEATQLPKALPERMTRQDIKNPQITFFKADKDSSVEYIFHKEPRLRTKFEKKEIDMTLSSLNKYEGANPKRSMKELKGVDFHTTYFYQEVFEGVDLRFTPKGKTLQEELILKNYQEIDSIDYTIDTIGFDITIRDNQVFFSQDVGSWEFMFEKPYMYEQNSKVMSIEELKNSGVEYSLGIIYELEKTQFGYTLSKKLTDEGKRWLADKNRAFPVIIDPTQYTSVIQTGYSTSEGIYGSPQRQIQFFEGATAGDCETSPGGCFYVTYIDAGNPAAERCSIYTNCDATTDWVSISTNLDNEAAANDGTDSGATSFKKDDKFYVGWADHLGDEYASARIHTTADTVDVQCNGPDLGTISDTNADPAIVAIGVTDDGDIFMALAETAGTLDTEGVGKFNSSCTNTDLTAATAGFDQDDRPEWNFRINSNDAYLWFVADNGLRLSVYVDDGTPGWDTADADVNGATANNTTTDMSAVSDGTDMWVMQRSGTTGDSESFKCSSCPTTSQTFTDIAEPWGSGLTTTSFVGLSYIITGNLLVAAMMEGSGTSERVVFKTTDADTISWSSQSTFGFVAGSSGLQGLSLTATASADTQVAATLQDSSGDGGNGELEFSTLPETALVLLLITPFLPKIMHSFQKRKKKKLM